MSLGISSLCRARLRLVRPAGLPQLPARPLLPSLSLRVESWLVARGHASEAAAPNRGTVPGRGGRGGAGKGRTRPETPKGLVNGLFRWAEEKHDGDGGASLSTKTTAATPAERDPRKGVRAFETSLDSGLIDDVEGPPAPQLVSDVQHAIETKTLLKNNPKLRNAVYRQIYRSIEPDDPLVQEKLDSPFVPKALDYPSPLSRRANLDSIHKAAKQLVAHDAIWNMHILEQKSALRSLTWKAILELLKETTPRKAEQGQVAAVRLILPQKLLFGFQSRNLEFVDPVTGETSRLRAFGDFANSTGVILRGPRKVLARAADQLVRSSSEVQVHELGKVTEQDLASTQLWPEERPSLVDQAAASGTDALVLQTHGKAAEPATGVEAAELLAMPASWSLHEVSSSITNIIDARLPLVLDPDRHSHLIAQVGRNNRNRDSVKARLIMKVLTDRNATRFIDAHTLKMALAFLVRHGGYIAVADRLLSFAEERGLPIDTEFFNILLEGYVVRMDHRYFYKLLTKMKSHFFQPNHQTWLLFLRLVQGNSERQQIVAAMYDLGMFDDPVTRRGIANAFARQQAHQIFSTVDPNVEKVISSLAKSYGRDWCIRETLSIILKEYLHTFGKDRDLSQLDLLLQQEPCDGRPLGLAFFNEILQYCTKTRDWTLAFWTLQQMDRRGVMPNEQSYIQLMRLGVWTKRRRAVSVIMFQGILEGRITSAMRWLLVRLFLEGRGKWFWRDHPPLVFNRAMLLDMSHQRRHTGHDEWRDMVQCVLTGCDGMLPAQPLAETAQEALRLDDIEFTQKTRVSEPLLFPLRDPSGLGPGRSISLEHSWDETRLDARLPLDDSSQPPSETRLAGDKRTKQRPERVSRVRMPRIPPSALNVILSLEDAQDAAMSSPEDVEQLRARIAHIQALEGDEFWGYDVRDAPQPSTDADDGILATLEIETGNADPDRVWEYFGYCQAGGPEDAEQLRSEIARRPRTNRRWLAGLFHSGTKNNEPLSSEKGIPIKK